MSRIVITLEDSPSEAVTISVSGCEELKPLNATPAEFLAASILEYVGTQGALELQPKPKDAP